MTKTENKDLERLHLEVDYEKYAHYLDSADLTEDQKQEFAQTLWTIIVDFVSLGFEVHPVQQAKTDCERNDEIAKNNVAAQFKMVECSPTTTSQYNKNAAATDTGETAEECAP